MNAPARIRIPVRRRQPERGLHLVVARFLDMALPDDAVWLHVPNGGSRNVVEAQVLKRMGVKAGAPDALIFYRAAAYGIELKPVGGYLSRAQKKMHEMLERAGVKLATCRSLDEVQESLDGWHIPIHARTFGFSA